MGVISSGMTVGGSTDAFPGGATGAFLGDSTGVTIGGSTVSIGSTSSAASMKGVDCSSLGCTGMLEGSLLKDDAFLVTVCSAF